MNKNDFCTFTQSQKLKSLGFDEPCFAYFDEDEVLHPVDTDFVNYREVSTILTKCPTKSQTLRFFREKFGLAGWVSSLYSMSSKYWFYDWEIRMLDDGNGIPNYKTGVSTNSYEQAETALIDKLIELAEVKMIKVKAIRIEKCFEVDAECPHCGCLSTDHIYVSQAKYIKQTACLDCGKEFEIEVKNNE